MTNRSSEPHVHDRQLLARVEREHLRRLAALGAISLVAGVGVARGAGTAAVRSFGRQNAAWGAIDLIIVGVSRGLAGRREPMTTRRFRRVLWVNAGLDLGYAGAGVLMIAGRSRLGRLPRYSADQAIGDGAAVVLQSLALAALDAHSATRLAGRAAE